MIKKWQNLLAQLEVENRPGHIGHDIRTEENLLAFETEIGVVFPAGYKEFCQIFGAVIFGDYIRFYCPDDKFLNKMLDALRDEMECEVEHNKSFDVEKITALLNSAFMFGYAPNGAYFLWNLDTYSELDKSYDIYLVSIDNLKAYKVGRNFFEFVCNFCLDIDSYKLLPKYLRPKIRDLRRTYTQFKS